MRTVLVLLSLWWTALALAQVDEGPLFGPEFTFHNPGVSSERLVKRIYDRAKKHLEYGQPPGAEFDVDLFDPWWTTFRSPNGWDFALTTDPGVVEIKVTPMTVRDFEKYAADLQDAVFVTAANEGAFPQHYMGGGHINIDFNYFQSKPLLLRNFLADLFNHTELFLGVFNFDTNNALSPVLLSKNKLELVELAFGVFDLIPDPGPEDIRQLINDIQLAMTGAYGDPYFRFWHSGGPSARGKNLALYLGHVAFDGQDSSRIELRGVRAQASMDVWVRQIRLLKKRIDYLATLPGPIAFRPNFSVEEVPSDAIITADQALNPPLGAHQALKHFHQYVSEAGEKIEDHLDYVWPRWISSGQVDEFLLRLELQHPCESILTSSQ